MAVCTTTICMLANAVKCYAGYALLKRVYTEFEKVLIHEVSLQLSKWVVDGVKSYSSEAVESGKEIEASEE
ncbi:MAG: hypothetical protein GY861_22475 [bacterium]|nr:hypothetical protein [bacterium]